MKVLSFGCGVQTVALAAMACLDEIERPDFAVFADTQWEKRATLEYLAWFAPWASARRLRIVTTTKGDLRADALNRDKRFASMPLWTETGFLVHQGKEKGALRRQCTNEYKIEPVNRVIRREAGLKPRQRWKGEPVELWLGISLDEVMRMKDSREAWVRYRYPLIERRLTRGDCVEYLTRRGLPVPPKSACVGCPFTDNAAWRRLKASSPAEFEDACKFDDAIRLARVSERAPVYLHPTLKPLRAANLNEDQPDMFAGGCVEGYCGT
jgi:hypothetical protein